ncbi:hypothetical protein ABIQ69_02400 [Agromyces sp. G08B096]|uniref:Uncharacterized protein n=1 Tax=Agromyces sp. G08B096 TaxID=3156399 RepID=A0AAU7W8N7_9MICO
MIRVLLSVLMGAGLAGVAAWILSADDAWSGLVIPCVIAFSVLLPLVLIVGGLAGSGGLAGLAGTPSADDLARAESEGRLALARVRRITRTGTSINDQPVCDLDLVVVPRFGSPFEVRTRRLVDLVEIPRLQPEEVVVVMTAERGPSAATIVMDPPDDWAVQARSDERVREVRTAPPFTPAPEHAQRAGLRRIPPAVYVVGALVGAAVALIPAYPTIAALMSGQTTLGEVRHAASDEGRAEAEAEAEAAAEAAAGMFVGDNAERAVGLLAEELGSPQVTQLSFWGSRLSAVAPSAPGAATLDDFLVERDGVERTGASADQPEPGELESLLFDASAIDYSVMPGLIAEARRLSGIEEPDPDRPDQWVYLDRSTPPGSDAAQIVFDVPISGEYYDAWITFSTTGEVLAMRGGAPGSASYEAEHAG